MSSTYTPPSTSPALPAEPTVQQTRDFLAFAICQKLKAEDAAAADWDAQWAKEIRQAQAWIETLTADNPPFAYPEPKTPSQATDCRVDADCNASRAHRNGNNELAQYWRKQSRMAAEKGAELSCAKVASRLENEGFLGRVSGKKELPMMRRIEVDPYRELCEQHLDMDGAGRCFSDADLGL